MINPSQIRKYYQDKSIDYGIGGKRLVHTLALLADVSRARILDVGFGTGSLGKYFKGNDNYVVGIDISARAVRKAQKFLDEVYTLDIERETLPLSQTFDVIILSEVLEHLFSPAKVVIKLLPHLKPFGKVLISTPNFLYWGNRVKFFFGRFNYEEFGPFDESHIRFFTYATLRKLIEETGLTISTENHLKAGPVSQALGKRFPSFFAYHFVVLCQKRK